MKKYFKLMRIHHYLKNILIFVPIVFSRNLFEIDILYSVIMGFIAFCFTASSIYVLNDICDVEKDRAHPSKCKRPIASGDVSINNAKVLFIILIAFSLFLSIFIIKSISVAILLFIYFFINVSYSIGMKNVPIVDIFILVLGFIIRVFYGAQIVDIKISEWLYLTIMSLSFFLGLGKRRNEIDKQGSRSRKVLKYYNREFLDKNMYIFLALTINFYSLWCMDNVHEPGVFDNIFLTIPVTIFICMKYSLNIEGNSNGDPVEVLLHDKILIGVVILYMIMMMFILYV